MKDEKEDDREFYEKMKKIQAKYFDQKELATIIEDSKLDYYKQLEKKLPEEPKEDEEYYSIRIKEKKGEEGFLRRFRPTDSIEDIKTFAKFKLRKNSDINMYSEHEGKVLYNTHLSIQDSGIGKNCNIVIHNEDDL
jgi:uncharacterized protein (UPF0248 family)